MLILDTIAIVFLTLAFAVNYREGTWFSAPVTPIAFALFAVSAGECGEWVYMATFIILALASHRRDS